MYITRERIIKIGIYKVANIGFSKPFLLFNICLEKLNRIATLSLKAFFHSLNKAFLVQIL